MGTMMALRAHVRGGPEQLVYEQAPMPAAGPGEVLIADYLRRADLGPVSGREKAAGSGQSDLPAGRRPAGFESGEHDRPPGKTVLVVR